MSVQIKIMQQHDLALIAEVQAKYAEMGIDLSPTQIARNAVRRGLREMLRNLGTKGENDG